VAHSCNPSNLRGRDQEDLGSKPAPQFLRPYLENIHHKKGLVEWLKVQALSSSPNTGKKKKELLNEVTNSSM
jgi:hypothetical protein